MEFDPIDPEDLTKIALQVFRQAFEDYLHLQHPTTRIKKYIHEAFISATEMFWDPEYRLDVFLNDDNKPMSLQDFLKLTSDRDNINMNSFKRYLQEQSETYWKNKHMNTIIIPDIMMICSTPYTISHIDYIGYQVDYNLRILYINKESTEKNNQNFILSIIEIICHHCNLQISETDQIILSTNFYEVLKINNSFRDLRVQKQENLISD